MNDTDDNSQLDEVQRHVTIDDDGGAAVGMVQTLQQQYPTDADDLWDAVTNPERLPRWFAPVSGDLRLGGTYQVEGNAGGTIRSCEPPKSFSITWEFGGAVTYVTVTVEPLGDDRAALTLEHAGDTPREFYDQFGPGATGVGWDLSLLGLSMYITTGTPRPVEADEWGRTDAARAFMIESSRRWADAAVAGGSDPAAATAAAERTAAFFTGV